MMKEEEKEICVYEPLKLCTGLFCEPHPCNHFLEMDEDKYEALKDYTIKAEVERITKTMR